MDSPPRFIPLFVALAVLGLAGRALADPPSLNWINDLTGCTEDVEFEISHATLLSESDANDPDGDEILFRFKSLTTGTLKKGDNGVVADDTLASGASWTWTPPANENGIKLAFEIQAFAGGEESGADVTVVIDVDEVDDPPVVGGTLAGPENAALSDAPMDDATPVEPVLIFDSVTVSDPDHNMPDPESLTVTVRVEKKADTYGTFDFQGLSPVVDGLYHVYELPAMDPVDAENALHLVTFTPFTNELPVGKHPFNVIIEAEDSTSPHPLEAVPLNDDIYVKSVNDLPVLSASLILSQIPDSGEYTPFRLSVTDPDPGDTFRVTIEELGPPGGSPLGTVLMPPDPIEGDAAAVSAAVTTVRYRPNPLPEPMPPTIFDVVVYDVHPHSSAEPPETSVTESLSMQVLFSNDRPTLSGVTTELIRTTDNPPAPGIHPFSTIHVGDADTGQELTVTLSLDDPAKGSFSGSFDSPGLITGSADEITEKLRNVIFIPTPNRLPVGLSETVTITISVDDSHIEVTNSLTQVEITSVDGAPVVQWQGGDVFPDPSEPALIDGSPPFTPFAEVKINDDGDVVVTLSIDDPEKGELDNLGGFTEIAPGSWIYDESNGGAGDAESAIQGIVFIPNDDFLFPPGQPGRTDFTIVASDAALNQTVCVLPIVLKNQARNYLVTSVLDDLEQPLVPGTLRHAVENAASDDVITFALPEYPAMIRLQETLEIKKHLSFRGPGPDKLRISGDKNANGATDADDVRLFKIEASVHMQGLRLERGFELTGGAVHVGRSAPDHAPGTLTLEDCVVAHCVASQYGGAIDVVEGELHVERCLFENNSLLAASGFGGGAVSLYTNEDCSFRNTTFSGNAQNSPIGFGGGALYVENHSATSLLRTDVIHCTFAENMDAADKGSSIHCNVANTRVILVNSIFADFSARNLQQAGGGEIVSGGGNLSNDNTSSIALVGGVPQLVTLLNRVSDPEQPDDDKVNAAPCLKPLGRVEGQTRAHALMPNSPAIGGGLDGFAMVDQRGVFRDQSVDSGAIDGEALGRLVIHEIFASQDPADTQFIEFYNPRDQKAVDLDGFEVWIDGVPVHRFNGTQVVEPGFGLILADADVPTPNTKTPVIHPPNETGMLNLRLRGTIEIGPTRSGPNPGDPDVLEVVEEVSYVAVFVDPASGVTTNLYDDDSITLAPQFAGAAFVPHRLVQPPPNGGVVIGFVGDSTSPGADSGKTPFGEDNAYPIAIADIFEISEDDVPELDVLFNDLDADGADELVIVDLNQEPVASGPPPAEDKAAITSLGGAGVAITPPDVPLRGSAVRYDPRDAYNHLPEGARVADSFAYSIIDIGGGAVMGYAETPSSETEVSAPAHRLEVGDTVTISGAGHASYNGEHVISAADADHFTIPVAFVLTDPPLSPLERGRWRAAVGRSPSERGEALSEVLILGRNDAPTPLDDSVAADEEQVLRIFGDPDIATIGMEFDTDELYDDPLGYAAIGLLYNDTDPDTDDQPYTQLHVVGVCQAEEVEGYAEDPATGTVIVTAPGHGLEDGATVLISGYGGHPSYNGYHAVTVTGPDTLSLPIVFIDDHLNKGLWTVLNDDNRLATTSVHGAEVTLEIRVDRTHTNVVYNPRPSAYLDGLAEGEPETDSFYYAVEDTHGAVSLAQVTVNVTGENDPPIPGNDPPGLAVLDSLLGGGTTLEGLLAGAEVLYILPTPDQAGQVFAALLPAGGGADDITVVPGLAWTDEDTAIGLPSAELQANDLEVDRLDVPRVEIWPSQALSRLGAAVSVSPDGSLVGYDPSAAPGLQALAHRERVVDTFEITINDGLDPVVSLVAVLVEGRNDKPDALPVALTTPENQLLELLPPGLLLHGIEIDQNMSLPDNQKFLLPASDVATTVFGAKVDVLLEGMGGPVNGFQQVAGSPGLTALVSPGHGLQSGEEVTLIDSGALDGLFVITRIDADSFSIPLAFDSSYPSLTGASWRNLASTFRYDPRGSVFSDLPGGPTFTLQGLAEGQSYPDTYEYTLLDGSFLFANDDIYRIESDRGDIELRVLVNDTNLEGLATDHWIVSVSAPSAGGSVSIHDEESLIYTPETGFVGDEVFVYTIEDDLGNRAGAMVIARVTVDRLNGNLRANGDSFTVATGQAPLLDVLANDNIIPASGDPLLLDSVSRAPDHGGLAQVENGRIRYTPDPAETGFPYTETFEYTMSGGGTASATASVSVLVVDRRETLNVRDDAFGIAAGGSPTTLNVLENDNILPGNGEDLEIASTTMPIYGTVTITDGVALSYTPPAVFLGTDTFSYTASDGLGGTGTAMVAVNVGYLTVNTDIFSVPSDDSGDTDDDGVTLLDVLANDNVLNGMPGELTITGVAMVAGDPALGMMDIHNDEMLEFDPAEGESGQADYEYTVSDATGRSATGTVSVVVIAGGIRASSDFFTVQTDSTENELLVLSNDLRISPLPGELSISGIGTGPDGPDQGGLVEISSDFRKLSYTAAPGFEGVESFTYTVTDGDSSNTALVSVRSTAGELAAADDAFLVFRGSEENRMAVLLNDRVIPDEGQLLHITVVGPDPGNPLNPPDRGTLEIIEDGAALLYTPHSENQAFPYQETFSYEISAGGTGRSEAILRIEVLDRVGVRDLETNHDRFTVASDSAGTLLPVLSNDSVLPASAGDWIITSVTPPTTNVCSAFLLSDFLDPALLAATLAAQGDAVSQFLWARFKAGAQAILSDPTSSDADLRTTLVAEFNDVAGSGSSIYDPARFAGVTLREQTRTLLDEGATGEQLIVLNRLLLEDAYPADLRIATDGGVAQIVGSRILYAPKPGFVGSERFSYRVSDGLGGTGFAEVIVRVGDISVSDDAFTVAADGGPVALDVTANDGILRESFPTPPDPAQADFSLSLVRPVGVDPPVAGTAVVDGDVVSFMPDAGFFGPAVLTYWVEDDAGCEFPGTARVDVRPTDDDRDSEVVTITVNGVNDPPQLVDADPSATDDETSLMPFVNSTLIEYDEQRSQQVTVTINYPAGQGTVTGPFIEISPGVLQFTGTETELTAALRALVFTPFTNRIPVGTTEDTQFTVSMDDGDVPSPVVVDTAVTTVTPVNDPPVITGTVAGQKLYQYSSLSPFVGVNVTEIDDLTLQAQVVTVQIDDPIKGVLSNLGGFVETPPGSGAYVFNGTAAAAATAVRGLVFTPTPGDRVTPSQPEIVAFDVTVDDGFAVPVVLDSVTTIEVLHAEIDSLLALDGTGQDDSQEDASFGASVAISGDTLVVGSPSRDSGAGSVFVHERLAGFGAPWGQVEELTASDSAAGDRFGTALAIDGDFLAVGATLEDAAVFDGGAVYIFHRNPADPNDWQQVVKLLPPVTNFFGYDLFGAALAIQGDTLLVGSPNSNRTGAPRGGQVFVFEHGPGGPGDWTLSQTLLPSDTRSSGLPEDEGRFGSAVALDGNTAVIGDPAANQATIVTDWNLGAAYIFTRTDTMSPWAETKRLDQFDDPAVPSFAGLGYSVDISGDRIAVGVHWDNGPFSANHPDSVRVYERDQPTAGQWGLVREIAPADGPVSENFGVSVAISGDLLMIGSPGPTDGSGETRGFVEVYRRDPGTAPVWTAIDRLAPGAIAAEDRHGQSVAIDGFIGVAGASEDSVNTLGEADAGSARVYKFHYDLGPRHARPVPDQLATPNAAFAFTVDPETFGDPVPPDDLILGVQLANGSPLPGGGWLSFNPATGEFSGTPVAGNSADYDLVLFADNPLGTRVLSNQFSITVELDLAGLLAQAYDDWASTQFSPTEFANPLLEATVWGMSANLDGDPHDNLMEMLFGTDPGSFDPSQLAFQKLNATQVELTFPLSSEFPLDAVHVEWSTDASNWSRDGVGLTTVPDGLGDLVATAVVTLPAPEPKLFVRIFAGP